MMNEMRTAGEIVLSGDGNYAASANGQCLLHVRGRLPSQQMMQMPVVKKSLVGAGGIPVVGPMGRPPEDVVKRTRSMNAYELSQDLLDKQIELLERKYGGHARANHAAKVIQRAFRHYSMRRKFAALTAMAKADQRRLSRRLHSELVDSAWNVTGTAGNGPLHHHHHQHYHHHHRHHQLLQSHHQHASMSSAEDSGTRAEYVIRTNFAALYRELAESVEGSSRVVSSSSNSSSSSSSTTTTTTSASRQVRLMSPAHLHHGHDGTNHAVLGPATAGHYQYHVQQQFEAQYHHHHHQAHYHGAPPPGGAPNGGSAAAPPAVSVPPVLVAPPPPPVTSHTPFGNHNHLTGPGELRRSDSQSKSSSGKRVPPEVPRRTSSSLSGGGKSPLPSQNSFGGGGDSPHPRQRSPCCPPGVPPPLPNPAGLMVEDHGQSSRRTSNLSAEHSTSEDSLENAGYSNTFWCEGHHPQNPPPHVNQHNNVHSSPVPFPPIHSGGGGGGGGAGQAAGGQPQQQASQQPTPTPAQAKVLECIRKRQYRVGLNLFNKKPERGIGYLTQKGFLEASPRAVAKFFITRKGISKQMIGEYLGNLQNPFNMATLDFFIEELDFAGLEVDVALRRFQTYFRMPGEAQKIERLMEVFGQRYCQCNPQVAARLRNPDTVFILAFAVIMLNTDLHTPSIKADKRMKLEDFIKNLRGIDDGSNVDQEMLTGIYERVKSAEFKPGADHVTQVLKVQQSIVGKKPNLVLPHRRLVCYCRLYEVADAGRRERAGLHQREVFLFNDILVVTKIFSKKKNGVTYSFRQSFQLAGLHVSYFESNHYPFGIRLSQRVDGRTLIMFNARNDHDRAKFCEDLREAILEMDEMEALRIEGELDKQRNSARISRAPNLTSPTSSTAADTASILQAAGVTVTATPTASSLPSASALASATVRDKSENRDSGVADMDHSGSVSTLEETCTPLSRRPSGGNGQGQGPRLMRQGSGSGGARPDVSLKRTTLSNSLLDMHDPAERYQRRGSVGSLDSGMSISFQSSTTTSTMSRDSSPKNLQHQMQLQQQQAAAMAAASALSSAAAAAATSTTNGGKARGLQHQSSFLGNIFHKARERKDSFNGGGGSCKQPVQGNGYPATPHCTDV